jgi:hypothetical protein
MEIIEGMEGPAVPAGMKESDLSAIMDRFEAEGKVGGSPQRKTEGAADSGPGGEWDQLTLLTGGFVPVGSIFWARPPKLRSQQEIMLALQKAQDAMLPFTPEAGANVALKAGFMEALAEQGNLMSKLAQKLFYVYEGGDRQSETKNLLIEGRLTLTKSDFRPATEEEIICDETGMSAEEIMMVTNRLLGYSQEATGNA